MIIVSFYLTFFNSKIKTISVFLNLTIVMLYLIIKYILSQNSDFFLAFVISYNSTKQDINLQEKTPDKSQLLSFVFI